MVGHGQIIVAERLAFLRNADDRIGVRHWQVEPDLHYSPLNDTARFWRAIKPMSADQTRRPALERIPTEVPGLDAILRRGLLRGGISIIKGSPGARKTILGNQICFRHIASRGRALYVTLLAEKHARMLLHISQLSFEEAAIPEQPMRLRLDRLADW